MLTIIGRIMEIDMSSYYRYNCSICNGTNLIWRGDVCWDSAGKKFEVGQVDSDTDAYCDDCDEEVHGNE